MKFCGRRESESAGFTYSIGRSISLMRSSEHTEPRLNLFMSMLISPRAGSVFFYHLALPLAANSVGMRMEQRFVGQKFSFFHVELISLVLGDGDVTELSFIFDFLVHLFSIQWWIQLNNVVKF